MYIYYLSYLVIYLAILVCFAGRITLSQSPPPVRNATYLRAFLLGFMCFGRFCQPARFLAARFTAQNSHEECNEFCGSFVFKTIIMPFKRLFVLWHSLIRSLYFIQVYIFIPLIHSTPFLRFSHIILYTKFFLCIFPCKIFLSLMTLFLGIKLLF